ncbi:glycosyltransferase family 4 protein [Vibrio campbellii]
MKKVIVLTSNYLKNNGVGFACSNNVKSLIKTGYDVTVYTDKAGSVSLFGEKVIVISEDKSRTLHCIISDENPDLLIAYCWHTWCVKTLYKVSKNNKKIKTCIMSHGTARRVKYNFKSRIYSMRWFFYNQFIKKNIKEIDLLVVLSDKKDTDRFEDNLIYDSIVTNKCRKVTIGNTVPDHFFKNKLSFPRKKQIVHVGAFTSLKNEKEILNAFLESNLDEFSLILIGKEDNEYLRIMKNTLKNTGKKVLFKVGIEHKEIIDIVSQASIVALSSKSECQPISLIESLSKGTPFVARNTGCISEYKGGVVYDNYEGLRRALDRLMIDEEYLKKLSDTGYEYCLDFHSESKNQNEFISEVARLINVEQESTNG